MDRSLGDVTATLRALASHLFADQYATLMTDHLAYLCQLGCHDWTVTSENVRARCLSFHGAIETFPFGPKTSVFKVAEKMFALCQLAESPLRVSLKCEPELAEQLRDAHPAVIPGYHLNKRHWNTVTIDGALSDEMIGDMIEDSYDLIVSRLPKARQRALGWRRDA